MNVLFDISHAVSGHGGVSSYLRDLLPELVAQATQDGSTLSWFQLRFRGKNVELPEEIADVDTRVLKFPVKLLNYLWIYANRPDLSQRYPDIDVFHSPHFSLPVITKAKTVLTVNDITYLRHPEYYQRSGRSLNNYGYKTLLSVNVKRADRIITISHFTKVDLVDWFGIAEDKIDVVHIGVPSQARLFYKELKHILQPFDLEPQTYVYYPVGTFEHRKNIPNTIRAYRNALESQGIRLVLSGVGDSSTIRKSYDSDSIRWIRWNTEQEKQGLYQGALFVVYPSLYEGFGIPIVEAMSNGCAVLTSNTTSMREIGEGYAHLVSPDDVDELTDGMRLIFENERYRKELETKSKTRAADFTVESMARNTYDVYRRAHGNTS